MNSHLRVLALGLVFGLSLTAAAQKNDEEYTKLIKQYLQDPRVTTELVDHMPASDTVPSPLKFFGRIPGTPGELTYAKDIYRYYEALAKASPRAKFWKIGQTEEGRDQVVLAIADEATMKHLDKYKGMLAAAGRSAQDHARSRRGELINTAKPIYWINSGIHSPETGGPEMLIELAYRLIVEETPFIQAIRNNVIIFITPVVEVDGREKQVDTYYYGKKTGKPKPPLMYWGKYVAHDNNRDGMGQYLKLTQNITKAVLEWHPDRPARPARGAVVPLRLHRHRPLQHFARSDPGQRVVAAGRDRSHGDGQARRPRRLDLRLLRRLGAQLSVLDRHHSQLLRPLLRSAELRPGHRGEPAAAAPPPPAANGTGRIRRCPPSTGARATTPTSRNRRCCSP